MHGNVFDTLASHLVKSNAIVVAPDLRGFGRSYFQSANPKSLDYTGSLADGQELLSWLKREYAELPIIVAGESLGAHLARSLAATSKEVNGLILSSPCTRPRMAIFELVPQMVSQAAKIGITRKLEADLLPFVMKFLQNEPDNLRQYLDDPMCRKSLDVLELIESMLLLGSLRPKQVPMSMPLLVYRGSNDGVCRNASYKQFMSSLRTDDMTVFECQSCAHLILQSTAIRDEILNALDDWLESHTFK